MPTLETYEQSDEASVPIEGYKFIGSFQTYRYTSSERVETINGEQYLPVAVSRSRVKAGTQEDDSLSLDLTIPFNVPVVMDYAYSQTPPKLELEVYRQQAGDPEAWTLYWQGKVRGFSVEDRKATIKIPSIFSLALQGEIPNVYYQVPCNHVLYDNRCKASRILHSVERTVLDTSPTLIQISSAPGADGLFAAGEIINMRNGERRLILSNVLDAITIGYPFVDLLPGDTVELAKGCDHSLAVCKAVFDNVVNHGGFKYIPADNPFDGSVA